ncbi:MAG: glutathione S-transferase family protein [Alphaproteobacteria bacterium]|nr:glutathione S-transferase family protein [Alphaproteobacteria bacterium]MBF0130044.1 glutathione S-transferase family protein [Alphaproteobacteria bacterium]
MRTLYHLWLSPHSRKVRVVLAEKKLEFMLSVERTWERRPEFLALNPAGEVPVLVEPDGNAYSDSSAICELLEELYPEHPLVGPTPVLRAEVRRLVAWFDCKFNREVTENLVGEKLGKRLIGVGGPDSRAIRAGQANIHLHLDYIQWLVERRRWLAGDFLSLADIAAAAHLSCLDYIGDVPWTDHPGAKDWYARIKSRPSFRSLLRDQVPGALPPRHYEDLDF